MLRKEVDSERVLVAKGALQPAGRKKNICVKKKGEEENREFLNCHKIEVAGRRNTPIATPSDSLTDSLTSYTNILQVNSNKMI